MLLVEDVLVSDDVMEAQFHCNLSACQGACCWEGDWGAPLDPEELPVLAAIYSDIEPFLAEEGKEAIQKEGYYTYYPDAGHYGTPLIPNGACAYMTRDARGVAQCGIEKAWQAGETSFRKPISCHLYPIRIKQDRRTGMQSMNYDRWDICSAACSLGKQKRLPVFRFAREAIIRKYGQAFYDQLEGYIEGSDKG